MFAQDIHLPRIFSDNMVVQREKPISIWGKAEPGKQITVHFAGESATANVDTSGKWMAKLPRMKAGGPFSMAISDGKDSVTFHNVLVGDVWVASGQSNMLFPLAEAKSHKLAIRNADYPNIRLFQVPLSVSNHPKYNISAGEWRECSPKTVPGFSAVAYFFGRYIHEKIKIPIGIIESAVGGTPAQYWTSKKMLRTIPEYAQQLDTTNSKPYYWSAPIADEKRQNAIKRFNNDAGIYNQSVNINSNDWRKINVPGVWENFNEVHFDGLGLYQKNVRIPNSWKGQNLIIKLGKIGDWDVTRFNGKRIGVTRNKKKSRIYKIPGSLVRSGNNIITINVLDLAGKGGLYDSSTNFVIQPENAPENASILLSGKWLFKADQESLIPAFQDNFKDGLSFLFNAMISPLIPYTLKGVIWYQGENNVDKPIQYRTLFPKLIQDWRIRWEQGYFPFLYVQIANWNVRQSHPVEHSPWSELREAQLLTLKNSPNTAMVVTTDTNDSTSAKQPMHPKHKEVVGKRLALAALHVAYGKNIVYSGPLYQSMKVKGDKVYLDFTHTGSGLTVKHAKELEGFSIAGKDKKFYWAKAVIKKNQVIVWSPEVLHPTAVRYDWQSNPKATLFNKEGLPASPFKTDVFNCTN